jgi:hypothetical protein
MKTEIKKIYLLTPILLILFINCGDNVPTNSNGNTPANNNFLIGTWELKHLTIIENGTDTTTASDYDTLPGLARTSFDTKGIRQKYTVTNDSTLIYTSFYTYEVFNDSIHYTPDSLLDSAGFHYFLPEYNKFEGTMVTTDTLTSAIVYSDNNTFIEQSISWRLANNLVIKEWNRISNTPQDFRSLF